MQLQKEKLYSNTNIELQKIDILTDYYIGYLSRQCSSIARKEVLSGKAKFGIFGDGKEVAQILLARQFQNGDWRSGYYRDNTFMFATGMSNPNEFFSQLYGNTLPDHNPSNGGRSFNNHYSTRSIDNEGNWLNLVNQKNSAADLSPTAGQMPHSLGLALASKLYRELGLHSQYPMFSNSGNEVTFVTIGDASTSEGHFFEVMNAAGVLQIPMVVTVWDDGFGISVPKDKQTIKSSISEVLKGFEKNNNSNGIKIFNAKGWNYPELLRVFEQGVSIAREQHIPVLFHITEMTQPSGHSTSGSHERYKTSERLQWEHDYDPLLKMRQWLIEKDIATIDELNTIEKNAVENANTAKDIAWKAYTEPLLLEKKELLDIVQKYDCVCKHHKVDKIMVIAENLANIEFPIRRDIISTARKILRNICADCLSREALYNELKKWLNSQLIDNNDRYCSKLHIENSHSTLNVKEIKPQYSENSSLVHGREIIRDNFDKLFEKNPLLLAFGEDVGKIGGVNQTYEGLQKKYGEWRVRDTGIREASIVGQGIGLALRGFRPIAEIQYFDYLLYALQIMSDDLATTHWRTNGGQVAPLIVSTRGHRLEGPWHSGSPLSLVINSIRGVYVCVPRNLTQAAGFYNTLLAGSDPALVIEPLNGYRLKEPMPINLGEFRVPLGVPEIITEGSDITIVTYGSCVRIAEEAVVQLNQFGIAVELIDVQTLLPFDLHHSIAHSVKKTGKVLFFDEDVPGGASAFMMQKVLEEQQALKHLTVPPKTLSARENRPAYSSDGDYFTNPNAEDVFEKAYSIMSKFDNTKWPLLF